MTSAASAFFEIGNEKLHYIVFGSGGELLFAFHGFGDRAEMFKVLEPALSKRYTIISVDLPYHGLSKWREDSELTVYQLTDFVNHMLADHKMHRFSLAGFSLGGKVSLAVYSALASQVDAIFLFAPDGLKNNIWYNIAVYPSAGRRLFWYVLHKPSWFLSFVRFLGTLRIIRKQYVQFLHKQLEHYEKRKLVWDIWMCLRGYERKRSHLRQLIQTYQTKVIIFSGRFDHIIKPSFGEKFCKGLVSAEHVVLDKGHYLLKEYLNEYLAARL